MARCCACLACGGLLGIVILGVTFLALTEFIDPPVPDLRQ